MEKHCISNFFPTHWFVFKIHIFLHVQMLWKKWSLFGFLRESYNIYLLKFPEWGLFLLWNCYPRVGWWLISDYKANISLADLTTASCSMTGVSLAKMGLDFVSQMRSLNFSHIMLLFVSFYFKFVPLGKNTNVLDLFKAFENISISGLLFKYIKSILERFGYTHIFRRLGNWGMFRGICIC